MINIIAAKHCNKTEGKTCTLVCSLVWEYGNVEMFPGVTANKNQACLTSSHIPCQSASMSLLPSVDNVTQTGDDTCYLVGIASYPVCEVSHICIIQLQWSTYECHNTMWQSNRKIRYQFSLPSVQFNHWNLIIWLDYGTDLSENNK